MISVLLFASFTALLLAGMPVTFAMGTAVLLGLCAGGYPLEVIPQLMARSAVNSTILAVPFFILAGNIMNSTGLTERMFFFARALVGHCRCGLAYVNILASVFFAGISGSAAADCAGLGTIEIRAMTEAGYRKPFSAAITLTSACIGPIIPPSIPFIVYGVMAEVSIARLFLAGLIPGILMALLLMGTVRLFALKGREYCPMDPPVSGRTRISAFGRAAPAFLPPALLLYGMSGGILTPGEAGIAAALTAAAAGTVCGKIFLSGWRTILTETASASAHILLLLGMAGVMGYLLAQERTPVLLGEFLISLTSDRNLVLLIILGIILLTGCFMSGTAAMILLTPVFLPVVKSLGIDLVHFGLIMSLGLAIGIATPPVGIGLFIVTEITRLPVEEVIRATLPFLLPLIAALVLVAFFPEIVLFLPGLLM